MGTKISLIKTDTVARLMQQRGGDRAVEPRDLAALDFLLTRAGKQDAIDRLPMWMGGVVPLGYLVEGRALHVVQDHAAIVRSLFRRYLEAGSVVRLKQQLDAEGFRIPIRIDGAGRSTGGGVLSRGHIYKILSNPIYVGRIAHKLQVHEAHHSPIVPQELWEQVQQSLGDHLGAARTKRTSQSSDALLVGKLYDDRGNRMSPTWARKESKRRLYYVSQAVLQGDNSKAGSILRVPAELREHLRSGSTDIFESLILAMMHKALRITDDLPTREFGRALGFDQSSWLHQVLSVGVVQKRIDFEN